MGVIRELGRRAVLAIWLLAPIPWVGLGLAALLDRGPGGAVRASAFPMALTIWDPFVWACLRNSAVVAGVVAAGSLGIGVNLARVVAPWRFRGRSLLVALAFAPMAIPPLFGAIGLRGLLGPPEDWPRVAVGGWVTPSSWGAWVGWVWLGLAAGVPPVALASARAIERVGPSAEDAARALGATRRQIWRRFVRPLVRPEAARVAAGVFAWTLFEPGAPILLGLRRTLSYQVVGEALGPSPFPRVAALTLAGLAASLAAGAILRSWGGRPSPPSESAPSRRTARASARRALGCAGLLAAWACVAWLPLLGLPRAAVLHDHGPSPGRPPSPAEVMARLLDDPEVIRLCANSIALGLASALIVLVGSWAMAGSGLRRPPGIGAFPPLAWGVVALALPRLARLGAEASGPGAISRALGGLADALDPVHSPGALLVAATVASCLVPLWAAGEGSRRSSRPSATDAALALGASRRKARRIGSGAAPLVPASSLVLVVALAATGLSPALLLTPTLDARAVAPGILLLADEPGGGLSRASGLAIVASAFSLIALSLALAARARPRTPVRAPRPDGGLGDLDSGIPRGGEREGDPPRGASPAGS